MPTFLGTLAVNFPMLSFLIYYEHYHLLVVAGVVHKLVRSCSCDGSVATVSARLENAFITTTTMILIAELVLLKLIMLSKYE